MGYPRKLLTSGEEVIREFRPHWRLLFIPVGWTLLFIAAIVVTWMAPPEIALIDWIVTAAALVGIGILGLSPLVNWWFTSYILTNERLITRSGVLARKGLEIPLENINDVQFSQNLLERVLRSGDLLIESAGEMGQSRFHDIPEPEEFQSLLYRVREDRSLELQAGGRSAEPTPVTAPDPNAGDRLERLAKLHDDGLITTAEFEEKKRRLLDEL